MEPSYADLFSEYRLVLVQWLEARDRYGLQDRETIKVALRVEKLKSELDRRKATTTATAA
jgi:hypothetical protein